MGKIALIASVGKTDKWKEIDVHQYVKSATLSFDFTKERDSDDVSIHNFLKALRQLRLEPSEIAIDLLVIACTMYAADTRTSRKDYAEDNWTRQIDLYIPVSDISLWNTQKSNLEKIFKFLTGDIWAIEFRQRSNKDMLLSPKGRKNKNYKMPYSTDTVCLFSGGLDSFVGAIDLIKNGTIPLLVSHSKSGDVSQFQHECESAISSTFNETPLKRINAYIKIPKTNLFASEDHTERGRSFMFLSLGAICASALGKATKLYVPENGFISLNIPLTPLRTGSHSTRTTHPHYFDKMGSLFSVIGLGVTIINPFQFKTKGEMLRECSAKTLLETANTMSCSHPSGRWEGQGNGHCGYCVPCIIRQAAFKSSGLKDNSHYRVSLFSKALDVSKAEGADVLAFKYLIEKVRENPMYITSAIRSTGPLGEDIDPYIDVYKRAVAEVSDFLNPIKLQ